MTASERNCTICKAKFYGRADALYCSPRCKQRSVRKRAKATRAAAQLMTVEELKIVWPAVDVLREHGYQREARRLAEMLRVDQGSVAVPKDGFKGIQIHGPCSR